MTNFCRRKVFRKAALNGIIFIGVLAAGCGMEKNSPGEKTDALYSQALLTEHVLPVNSSDVVVDSPIEPPPTAPNPPAPAASEAPTLLPDRSAWTTISLIVRNNPREPYNERFLDSWHLEVFNITDKGEQTGPSFFSWTDGNGMKELSIPAYLGNEPMVIKARNELLALECKNNNNNFCKQGSFEIFIPGHCYDKAVWLLGPLEDALWQYYKKAASRGSEAWTPSQVDCGSWYADMLPLIVSDPVSDALDDKVDITKALTLAFQENQQSLVPTRQPICLATEFHSAGSLQKGKEIGSPLVLKTNDSNSIIELSKNGTPTNICGLSITASWQVNYNEFASVKNYHLDSDDFSGIVQEQENLSRLDISLYNVKLGNGQRMDRDAYSDACALTGLMEFSNKDKLNEQKLHSGTGVQFLDLFGAGPNNTTVFMTSSGDKVVDDEDTWAIFYDTLSLKGQERVLAVELLGHRSADYQDALHIKFDSSSDNLFLGLKAPFELDEYGVDGNLAYMAYTIHTWDGSSAEGKKALRKSLASCLEAAEPWARQFFSYSDIEMSEQCVNGTCTMQSNMKALAAAEFAVRSQCFSNSKANQRWQNDQSAFWNIGSNKGSRSNVIVNAGWLAPDLEFNLYIQKFDEAVFKGPRLSKKTDELGQLLIEIPTLVEGDRVLLKAKDSCCKGYDLVIPCVPEFSGFKGVPPVPFPQPAEMPRERPIGIASIR